MINLIGRVCKLDWTTSNPAIENVNKYSKLTSQLHMISNDVKHVKTNQLITNIFKEKMTKVKKTFNKTGALNEDTDFSNHLKKENQTESQPLLPHERDESVESDSTEKQDDKHSRKVIKKAHEDVRRGLLDTDRRGIPSDIIESEIPAADDTPNVPDNEKDKKR